MAKVISNCNATIGASIGNTCNGNTGIIHETDRSLLTEWTSFEDAEGIVSPYLDEVIYKILYGQYKSARTVFDDYKICNILRTKLMDEKVKLTVAIYVNEHFLHYALQKKAKMLGSFSTMLADAALQDDHKLWIQEQLEKFDHLGLHSESADFIEQLGTIVKAMAEDVQSVINKQKEEKFKDLEKFHPNQNEFQVDNFVKKKKEFEDLEDTISSVRGNLRLLTKHSSTCNGTLLDLKDRITSWLRMVFYKMLPENEDDLAKMWSEERQRMEYQVLVRRGGKI